MNDVTDGEIFEMCVLIDQIWTVIHRLIWAKIEGGTPGYLGWGTPCLDLG